MASIKILQVCQVSPATNSNEPVQRFSLPLTFLDTRLLKFPQAERIYFYKLTELSSFFHSVLLPRLKRSLSYTLLHFLPLAGHLTWPSHSPKPIINYAPNDAVSLTVAESNAEFDILVGNEIRQVAELRPYLPELSMSDTMVSVISLQITLFPNKGFAIGIAMHHAVVDGKSASMFLKAWAHTCKQTHSGQIKTFPLLPDQLIPSFDRSVIEDPDGLDSYYLNHWLAITGSYSKSKRFCLKLLQNPAQLPSNLVRATFELSLHSIGKIRESVAHYYNNRPVQQLHLSTFVIVCAYVLVCLVKARGGDSNRMVYFLVAADCRSRLDPPISQNYFGNCVFTHDMAAEAATFMEESGVAIAAKKVSDLIKGLEKGSVFEGAKERHARLRSCAAAEAEAQRIAVVGSPRFQYYKEDFGWGKPEKAEITTIDRINGVSLKEGRDENGSVELGLVLPGHEMEAFALLFYSAQNDI